MIIVVVNLIFDLNTGIAVVKINLAADDSLARSSSIVEMEDMIPELRVVRINQEVSRESVA